MLTVLHVDIGLVVRQRFPPVDHAVILRAFYADAKVTHVACHRFSVTRVVRTDTYRLSVRSGAARTCRVHRNVLFVVVSAVVLLLVIEVAVLERRMQDTSSRRSNNKSTWRDSRARFCRSSTTTTTTAQLSRRTYRPITSNRHHRRTRTGRRPKRQDRHMQCRTRGKDHCTSPRVNYRY